MTEAAKREVAERSRKVIEDHMRVSASLLAENHKLRTMVSKLREIVCWMWPSIVSEKRLQTTDLYQEARLVVEGEDEQHKGT